MLAIQIDLSRFIRALIFEGKFVLLNNDLSDTELAVLINIMLYIIVYYIYIM